MITEGWRDQLGRLAGLIVMVVAGTALLVAIALLAAAARDSDMEALFLDVYELSGTRIAGLLSMVGVALLAMTAGICGFAAGIARSRSGARGWTSYLFGAALVTAVLALDDYLSIHELADDILQAATGVEAGRLLKNLLELAVLGTYGVLLALLLSVSRPIVARTEWLLLVIAGVCLFASLALDLAPHSWLATDVGISLMLQGLVEDTLKLVGIAFYSTYFVRTSALAMRQTSSGLGRSS